MKNEKFDKKLLRDLENLKEGETIRALVSLTPLPKEPTVIQPNEFGSHVEYREALVKKRKALAEKYHGPVFEKCVETGADVKNKPFSGSVVMNATKEQLSQISEFEEVVSICSDLPLTLIQ